jgi:hypothetical protein
MVVGSVTAERVRLIWIRPNVRNSFTRQFRGRIVAMADGCAVVGELGWPRAARLGVHGGVRWADVESGGSRGPRPAEESPLGVLQR